jgi:hypothetical protein
MNDAPQIDLDAVGELVASSIDGRIAPAARLAGRERLVRAAEHPRRRKKWIGASVGALACAAALVLWWAWPRATQVPVDVRVDAPIASRTSEWMQAPTVGSVTLPVGEGASLSLHDGARGRVSIADDDQVGVALEAGTLRAEVDPQAHRHVVVEAGPHRVHVIGTVFAVKWSPNDGRFEVEVTRGKVEVHTPSSSAAIAVDAGRRLVAEPSGEVKLTAIERSEPVPMPAPIPEPEPEDPPTPRPRAKPRATPEPLQTWESLAKAGKYADAFALIETSGFDTALASLPAASLEQLADVARLAGRTAKAEAAYTKLRSRFSGTAAAARAAFQLGRLAADSSRKPKDAVRWLETYLSEAPQGSFAKLARGRLMVALRDAGDRTAARAAARVYVDSYPDGPHAKIAAALLESH